MDVEGPNDGDADDRERRLEGLAEWMFGALGAFDRRAPLADIRDLVLRQLPEALRAQVQIGTWCLLMLFRRSHQGRQRRGRGGGGGRPRGGYPTLPMVKFLVEEAGWGPESLSVMDPNGYLVLHEALIGNAPPTIVRYLVQMAPHAVRVRVPESLWERGFYPIHLAVDRHVRNHDDGDDADEYIDMLPWETVQCLLDAWPESIQQTSKDGWIPLHHALRHLHRNRPKDRRVVRGLIDRWPESLQWKTKDGHEQLAFHVAVSTSVPVPDLRYLLDAYPEAIRTPTCSWNNSYLPIHLAFVQPDGSLRPAGVAALPTIRFLVEACPSALLVRTPKGAIPLHLALKSESVDEDERAPILPVVQYLVEACPKSLREPSNEDRDGWIALHHAAQNPYTSPDVIRYLVSQHPESVMVQETDHRHTPLHVAAESDLSVDGMEALIRAGPMALQARTSRGELPIHVLLAGGGHDRNRWRHDPRHGNLLGAVVCLVRHAGPSCLRVHTNPQPARGTTIAQGKIPLHSALLVTATESSEEDNDDAAIEYLLEQWPESVRVATTDRLGWLALHCAARLGRSVRLLRLLLRAWPDSIRQVTRDDTHKLAIHLAASTFLTSVPSVELLLDEWPESALEMSGEGWMPIHYAAGDQGAAETIECLLDRHPETIRSATRSGFLPIHLAALRRCRRGIDFWAARTRRLEVIRCLVARDPDSLLARSASPTGSLPLHLAFRSDVLDVDVVNFLVNACPDSVRHCDASGSLPLHIALARALPERGPDRDNLRSVVESLVALHPESLQMADSRGRLPVHVAAESEHASLDVLYLLIRRRPDSIRGGERGSDDGPAGGGHTRRRRPATAISSRGRRDATAKRRRADAAP